MTIQSVYELFELDGEDFVTAAYKNLLCREPDKHGLAYYSGRLSLGYGKESVIAQIAKSPECKTHHDIKDLKQIINNEKRARYWFFRLFISNRQKHNSMQSNLNMLARIRQNISAVQDAISTQSQQSSMFTQQIVSLNQANQLLNQRIVELTQQLVSFNPSCKPDETPLLSDEVVCQCFVEILGHEPESEEIIKEHACLPSREALQEKLIHSEEFQNKLLAQAEHARLICKRLIQHQTKLQEI